MESILKTLIFLHGGPGLPDYLEPVFSKKFGSDFQTIFYAQKQKDVKSIDDLIDELDGYVVKYKGKVFLVGHSWGGMLATEYALRFPERIAGIILISSAYSSSFKGQGERVLKDMGLGKDPLDPFLSMEERKEWAPFIQSILDKVNTTLYTVIDQSYMRMFDNTDRICKANFPILNIYGDQDYCIISSHERELGKLNNRIENLEIKGAGHFPFLLEEDRKAVIHRIEEFVDNHPAI